MSGPPCARFSRSCSPPAIFKNRDESIGVSVNDTNMDTMIANATVTP
jgi:hypothetical protein